MPRSSVLAPASGIGTFVLALALLVGCGPRTDGAPTSVSGERPGATVGAPATYPRCDSFDGVATGEALVHFSTSNFCLRQDVGSTVIVNPGAMLERVCDDGLTLHWNASGWGRSDSTWSLHRGDERQPPADARRACG